MGFQMVDLLEMRNTTRRMSGRYSVQQMTDAQIDRYINLFMTLMLPLYFKNIKLTKPYVFNTIPNVDTYDFVYQNGLQVNAAGDPVSGNVQITPPAYCQGYLLRYYQDKTTFYNRWPNLSVNQQINSGGNVDVLLAYNGTIPSTPFYRAQLDIFGNVTEPFVIISAFDNDPNSITSGFNYAITDIPMPNSNTGSLVESDGTVVGTVNYLSGLYTFTPTAALPVGIPIFAAVVPYQPSRPTDVLFYNQQLVFRPCPMQIYQVEFQISQQPLDLIADTSFPELDEWYLFICAGASKLIYTDFPDEVGMGYLIPIWEEQLQIAQRRTLRQLSSQRAATIFSQPGRPLASWFWGTQYSGN